MWNEIEKILKEKHMSIYRLAEREVNEVWILEMH